MGNLGYTDHEEGYRHGKRDFKVGLRSPDLLTMESEYAAGYRAGLNESITAYHAWIEREDPRADDGGSLQVFDWEEIEQAL